MSNKEYDQFFIARQPIFDRTRKVFGYELLFRNSRYATKAAFQDHEMATNKVIADGFALAAQGVEDDKLLFVNVPQGLLLNGTVEALPKERACVEILETVRPDRVLLDACRDLREKGYRLVLDDYTGQPELGPLLDVVQVVKMDVMALKRLSWSPLLRTLKDLGLTVVAEKVEDWSMFQQAMDEGFDAFQGYYFCRPEVVPGRKLGSSTVSRVRLLKLLNEPGDHMEDLPEIISEDPALSYRLLTFINSAAFSLKAKVSSIQQAATLLGFRPLKRWITVVILSDIDSSAKGQELVYHALHRARFLEMLKEHAELTQHQPNELFLLGLFSVLDGLLGLPMADVLNTIPLEPTLHQALNGEDNPLAAWKQLVEAGDRGDWAAASACLKTLGIKHATAARCFLAASNWANKKLWTLKTR